MYERSIALLLSVLVPAAPAFAEDMSLPRPGSQGEKLCNYAFDLVGRCFRQTTTQAPCPILQVTSEIQGEFLPKFDIGLSSARSRALSAKLERACRMGCDARRRSHTPPFKPRVCRVLELDKE